MTMTDNRDWRVWLIYDQRDGSVFATGCGRAEEAQPMPDDVRQKIDELGRHAKVREIGSGMTEADAMEKWERWGRLPAPVVVADELPSQSKPADQGRMALRR
jgi:hypothetical protein